MACAPRIRRSARATRYRRATPWGSGTIPIAPRRVRRAWVRRPPAAATAIRTKRPVAETAIKVPRRAATGPTAAAGMSLALRTTTTPARPARRIRASSQERSHATRAVSSPLACRISERTRPVLPAVSITNAEAHQRDIPPGGTSVRERETATRSMVLTRLCLLARTRSRSLSKQTFRVLRSSGWTSTRAAFRCFAANGRVLFPRPSSFPHLQAPTRRQLISP